ncbi:MAG TPA: BamA/TamA family outer membrane protein [Balneolaceae bacterium]|nr:BamA/TamA family outer membrane protein [Balneolaceae bacterium]
MVSAAQSASGAAIPAQVWKIEFDGNQQYSDLVLKKQISTESPNFWQKLKFWDRAGHELDETEVKKDVIRIRNYYQRRGYINVKVSYEIKTGNKSWKKIVIFNIDENYPVRIKSVNYELNTNGTDSLKVKKSSSFVKAQHEQAYQAGTRYQTIKEPEVVGLFTDVFKNLGFAYAKVGIRAKVDTVKLRARLTINCNLGPRTYIDSIRVDGAQHISKHYVIRQSGLHTGELYNMDELQQAQQQLFNHHLFKFATISIPDQPQDTSLTLLMRVRENKERSVEVLAGFGTEEKLRGELSWTHRNAFHAGHRFTTTARASFIEQSVNLNYLFPYIYNAKSSIVISPFGQHLLQSSYELLRAGVTNTFIYQYSQKLTGSASYEYTKNKELSQQLNANLPDTTREYDLSSFQFSSYYNQGFGRQQEGWVIQPYAEVSGLFGLAKFQFQKLSVDIRRFTRLSSSTMLAARVQGGGLFNVANDSLPNNIRFYLGGTNSVRGWYRQQLGPKQARTDSSGFVRYVPLGGRAMFGFNIEIRQDLNFFIDGLGMAAFLDGGQIWQRVDALDTRPLQFGAGAGLRYQSPIGPLRIDIGYKLNPTAADLNRYQGHNYGSAWNRIGIHFSIGQAF